ncbi:hypothetical protein [uncultured Ruminococcus sp.]|uniref:hypothetical protein n=1 Tax=uncultured Ruminococcus sp. TaxID=165186 RepID=UPI00261D5408|nr:hypothetical protein [uncultured Ruminococcus sp.]
MAPTSKAQQKAVHKYVKSNYDRIELTVPKGKKEQIKAAAESSGKSLNGYINEAIDEKMRAEHEGTPE